MLQANERGWLPAVMQNFEINEPIFLYHHTTCFKRLGYFFKERGKYGSLLLHNLLPETYRYGTKIKRTIKENIGTQKRDQNGSRTVLEVGIIGQNQLQRTRIYVRFT